MGVINAAFPAKSVMGCLRVKLVPVRGWDVADKGKLSLPVTSRRARGSLLCCCDINDKGHHETSDLQEDQEDAAEISIESTALPNVLNPTDVIKWGGTLPNKRRTIQSLALASFFALGGNLGGLTSFLLSLDGGSFAARVKLDTVVPVNGFKRCVGKDYGFEFSYPASWLADQSLVLRAAERMERENPLDPPPIQQKRRQAQLEPVAAYGPPGSNGEENVSVVAAPSAPGFQLTSLGSPREAGLKLLDGVIAPEGSGKVANLLNASERYGVGSQLYYTLEFTVRTEEWFRHNVSVYAITRSNMLLSLTVQCPEYLWDKQSSRLLTTAESFFLT